MLKAVSHKLKVFVKSLRLPKRYAILSELGSGGMGSVYKAKDSHLDKVVAVKILNQSVIEDTNAVKRFQREAQAAGRLKHDNLVTVLDFGMTEEGLPYLVMDYAKGVTLKELISKQGSFSTEFALNLFTQLVSGMAHAHRHGVIHRDLKTANVVVMEEETGSYQVKIVDFGIARIIDDVGPKTDITITNAIIGSPLYMSPEQVRGSKSDERSDVYSLGCIFYECLTGNPPFRGNTAMDTMNMHLLSDPPRLGEIGRTDFYSYFQTIIQKMLEKSADDRYQSMEEVLAALEEIEEEDQNEDTEIDIDRPKSNWDTKSTLIIFCFTSLVIICLVNYPIMEQNQSQKTATKIGKQSQFKNSYQSSDFDNEYLKEKYKNDTKTSELNLDSWPITNKGLSYIAHLPLRSLNLSATKITDEGFRTIASIKTIQSLKAERLNITETGITHLKELPELRTLYIGYNNFNDELFQAVAKIKSLEQLFLSFNTNISGAGIERLNSLANLRVISLNGTSIEIQYLARLQCPELQSLFIKRGHNSRSVTNKDIDYMLHFKKLQNLVLIGNSELTDEGLLKLRKLKHLKFLNIRDCNLVSVRAIKKFQQSNTTCKINF